LVFFSLFQLSTNRRQDREDLPSEIKGIKRIKGIKGIKGIKEIKGIKGIKEIKGWREERFEGWLG